MYRTMTDTDLAAAVEAAVYTPDSVNHISIGVFQATFGAPTGAQWLTLFDYYGVSKLGRLIALGMDHSNVGRIRRESRPTAVVIAQSLLS